MWACQENNGSSNPAAKRHSERTLFKAKQRGKHIFKLNRMIHNKNNHTVGETKSTNSNSGTATPVLPGIVSNNYHNV